MSNDRHPGSAPGNRVVDEAWRRAAVDEPSARVDAAILGAARAAAAAAPGHPVSPPKHGRWGYWRPMAAAATVAALALLLVPRTEREERLRNAPVQSPVTEAAAPALDAAPAEEPSSLPAAATTEATAKAAAAQPEPAEPLAERTPAPPPTARAAAAAEASGSTLNPQEWAYRIESLHAAGDATGAADALQEFRRAYPDADARLPPELRSWAAAVPRKP